MEATQVIPMVMLALSLFRTILVVDGVLDFHGYRSLVYRISSYWCSGQPSPSGDDLPGLSGAALRTSRMHGNDNPGKFRYVFQHT